MGMQKYKRDDVEYVLVEFCMPFIQYGRSKPNAEVQQADQEKGYLTPFKTFWTRNSAEGEQEQLCASIITSFKPKYQRGKFKIPHVVSGDRHGRDVKAQLLTVSQDWEERGLQVDLST